MPHTVPELAHIGKRLPYTVPDGYFEQMATRLTEAVKPADHAPQKAATPCPRRSRRLAFALCAAAAAVAIVCLIAPWTGTGRDAATLTTTDLAQAFDALTPADQDFLLDLYQEDPFINDNTYSYDETDEATPLD